MFVLLLLQTLLCADTANGNARLERMYSQFIAPCCWRENLLVHRSPKADELRAEIQQLLAAGRTEEQIKLSLVAAYSARILSMPEGARGRWLAWTPVLATLAGLGVVVTVIRQLRLPAQLEESR